MATVFTAARSARTFQNSLSYPFYVLGGVLVPVEMLPGWVQPLSRGVFLSWSSDLLRDSLAYPPVASLGFRVAVILLLGLVGFGLGWWLMGRVIDRLKRIGTVKYA
ncbi:MAG: ABC transporter permease, partial [Acidimicrobiia bacterium]|nr:ABC transporter permease [Acidimicrobiia bacterium]